MERVVKTYCSVCERTCGMQVTAKDNRVVKVEGLKEHVKSKGDLCVKGKAALDIMYAPDRLKYPMKKENGSWKQINWEEALNILSENLGTIKEKYGASSLGVYHGQTYVKNCISMFSMKRFLNAYGSVNLCSAASECFIPHLLNGIATFGSLAFADVERSNCIIIWGSNPFASGSMEACSMPRTIKLFTEIKEKGTRFIVIDPRTPAIAKLADIHLKIRPGTDGALALGMMRILVDKGLYDNEFVEKHTSGFDKLEEMLQEFDLKKVEGEIVLLDNLTLAVFNKLEALEATGAVCLEMDKGIEQEADEAGVLVLAEKDYEKVCQLAKKRAKVDVGDRRLIIAK